MNEKSSNYQFDPEIEARIVALVLGEASDFERDELMRLIDVHPELAGLHQHFQRVHGLLHDVATTEPFADDDEWKLSSDKRTKLLAVIDEGHQETTSQHIVHFPTAQRAKTDQRLLWKFSKIAAILIGATFLGSAALLTNFGLGLKDAATGIALARRETSAIATSDSSEALIGGTIITGHAGVLSDFEGDEAIDAEVRFESKGLGTTNFEYERDSKLALSSIEEMTAGRTTVTGQALPSPYYLYDDVQYAPTEADGELSQEASKIRAALEDESLANSSSVKPIESQRAQIELGFSDALTDVDQSAESWADRQSATQRPDGEWALSFPKDAKGFGEPNSPKSSEASEQNVTLPNGDLLMPGGINLYLESEVERSPSELSRDEPIVASNGTIQERGFADTLSAQEFVAPSVTRLFRSDTVEGRGSKERLLTPRIVIQEEEEQHYGAAQEGFGSMAAGKTANLSGEELLAWEDQGQSAENRYARQHESNGSVPPLANSGSRPARARVSELQSKLAQPRGAQIQPDELKSTLSAAEGELFGTTADAIVAGTDFGSYGIPSDGEIPVEGDGYREFGGREEAWTFEQKQQTTTERMFREMAPQQMDMWGADGREELAPSKFMAPETATGLTDMQIDARGKSTEVTPEFSNVRPKSESGPTNTPAALGEGLENVSPHVFPERRLENFTKGSDAQINEDFLADDGGVTLDGGLQYGRPNSQRQSGASEGLPLEPGGGQTEPSAAYAQLGNRNDALARKSLEKISELNNFYFDSGIDVSGTEPADRSSNGRYRIVSPAPSFSLDGIADEFRWDFGGDSSGGERGQVPTSDDLAMLDAQSRWYGYVPPMLDSVKKSKKKSLANRRVIPPELEELSAQDIGSSTFSLHVSDVSFKLAQAALAQGEWPEAAKVRIEEFVNAFDYGDPMPRKSEKVACRVEQCIHPFLQQRNLLRVAMRTSAAGRANNTPLRLTLLLDNSGSMERSDRQQTVRRAFALLARQLRPTDQVTLISFASQPRLLADQVNGGQASQLVELIGNLPSEGGTNMEAALQLAFEKAQEQQVDGAQNRVILLTDGAVNLGNADPESLSRMITTMRDMGIAFDSAGICAEGLNDDVLEALTRDGDGRYYLLDTYEAADDGFARQIAGALRPSAKNVKVQIQFNPKRVGRYKLLGFEKHRLSKEDFRNDAVDAAEMSAAEAGVAVYQFEAKPDGEGDVGSVSVRFRDLSTGQMIENRWPIPYESDAPRTDQAAPSLRIASSAALLAAKLRGDSLGQTVDLKALSTLLAELPAHWRRLRRVEQLQQMIQQARQLSGSK